MLSKDDTAIKACIYALAATLLAMDCRKHMRLPKPSADRLFRSPSCPARQLNVIPSSYNTTHVNSQHWHDVGDEVIASFR